MQECRELCRAAGLSVLAVITQQARSLDPKTGFRMGKLEEMKRTAEAVQADGIVFCNRLPLAPTAAVAEACGLPVMDRTALILEIFSRRARSQQAKLQVEAARLAYALPRLAHEEDEAETHQRGGGYQNRGGGEMRAASIRKRYQSRISLLNRQLAQLEAHQQEQRAHRNKSLLGRAALVGYTNAGKSSLLNEMTRLAGASEKTVLEEDMLFATLDTSIRRITWEGRSFLLYDTVGFISDLPHELIKAFQSTLAAAREANLLIEVIDVSQPGWQDQAAVTEATLKEIHADRIPLLRVFNKSDLVAAEKLPEGLHTSCLDGSGVPELIRAVEDALYPVQETISCLVPYEQIGLINANRNALKITAEQETEKGWKMVISGPSAQVRPFHKYEIREGEKHER
jgi:GTP-binding protein HflX